MKPDASALEFATYAAARWRQIGYSCLAAVLLAGLAGLVLPKRYTATATLLIEPPAGTDPRMATSVSPIYMESLKTYEHLASSDSLFVEALEHQKIRARYADRTIESLKSSVLKVSKPANTRILEISATLDDPKEAQGLAQYIAERTAALNRTLDTRSTSDAITQARSTFESADERLKTVRKASTDFAPTIAGLEAEIANASDLQYKVQRDLIDGTGSTPNLQKANRELENTIRLKSSELQRARTTRETLDAELDGARTAWEAAKAKLDDVRASVAFRGERLELLDPGIVPQSPSFPNTPLNLIVALLISLIASLTYLAFRFGYERASVPRHERVYSRIA